jgi:hypothetical protein
MSNQTNLTLPHPSGHIQYAFDMLLSHDKKISFKIVHPKVNNIVFEKVNSTDQFDDKWLMTVHTGEVSSIKEVQEMGNAIKDIIVDTLALTLNTKIGEMKMVGYNLVPRFGEGAICNTCLEIESIGAGKVGCSKLNSNDIQEIQNAFLTMPNSNYRHLITLFRYAISTDEPVFQFMLLYLILSEIQHHKQSAVDKYIMKVAPSTPQSVSPHESKIMETIYTKLRNEITHRTNVVYETTRAEIINHLYEFRRIVCTAIKKTM